MRRLILCLIASVLTTAASGVSAQGQLPPCPGSYDKASWTNCVGKTTYPSGDKYVGEFKDGKSHGQGTYTFPLGEKYIGEFKDGKRNGQGAHTWPDGAKYVGEYKDDKPKGQGTTTYPSGDKYVGEFKDNKLHGQEERRLLAIQMMERLQAQIEKRMTEYQTRPRKRFIGTIPREHRFAKYEEDWRAKIERVGTLNYPAEARGKIYGNLRLAVTIRPDGAVESIELDRSSGHKALDDAAFRIVRMAAPFAAFPVEIRKDTDLLVITQTWFFAQGTKVWTE